MFITYGRVFIDSQATKDKNMISTNNFFSTLIFLMPAFSYAQTADMPSLDAFKVGEKSEWVQKDNRTKSVEQKLINTVVSSNGLLKMSNGSSERDILINYTGDPKATKQWRVWPLEIGKKWAYAIDWVNSSGSPGYTNQNAEVLAYEEVTVPAGKFMAFKIKYEGWWRMKWGSGGGRQDDVYWYAPDSKADVKHIREDGTNMYTRELVNYQKAP